MGGLFIGYQIKSIPISQERKSTSVLHLFYRILVDLRKTIIRRQLNRARVISSKFGWYKKVQRFALILTQILTTYNHKDLIERVLIKS